MIRRHLPAALGLAACLVFAAGSVARAQEDRTVRGRVVDPEGRPIGDAEARVTGTYRSTVTGADGRFRIELPAEARGLRFQRVGYRTRALTLGRARGGPGDTLRVTLRPNPVELKGLSVENRRDRAGAVFGRTVTRRTVRQAPALGEADVFRSLVHLPDVAQPNDLKGRIHLAGGSSDETGFRLDGHPLQEPFHLLGLMGAMNVSALESADVLVHRYPIREGGRLSGLVDFETRRTGDDPASEAVVSVLSSSFTTSRPDVVGGIDVLASGRITYLDRLAPAFADDVPRLGFWDGLVRLGKSWGGGWRAELLGFRTQNHFRGGDIKSLEREVQESRDPFTWGESLAGVRLERRTGGWRFSARGSVNRATTSLDERPVDDDLIDSTRDWWSTGLEVTRLAGDWRATAGASFDHRRHRQRWTAGELADELFSPNAPAAFSGSDERSMLALFGEVARDLGPRLRGTIGGRAVAAGGGWHAAPRALLTWDATGDLGLELSAERRLQFDAEIEEPVEGSVIPPRFLLEEPRRTDVLAAAAAWSPGELPLVGTEGRLRVVGFWKRYPDRPVLAEFETPFDPDTPPPGFPRFLRVDGRSVGASLALRLRIGEGGLFQGSYTYQRAREEIGDDLSPTTWDLPHNLSVFGSVPVFGGWTANAAFRLHSGRAVTPVRSRVFAPERGFGQFLESRFFFGDRNSLRLGGYARLDLGVRHRFDFLDADWVFFGQVLNTLGSRNPVDVDFGELLQARASGLSGGIRSGLPTVPSFGVEVKW